MASPSRRLVNILQEFSIPLILGVVAAIVFANANHELYENIVHLPLSKLALLGSGSGTESLHATRFTAHFLINDIFMVLFFGIAAKEIVESCLPGGALNPLNRAFNPLLGTLGGVLGPVAVYLFLNSVMGRTEWSGGWGIPTATDIALAWLVARAAFGKGHPAVSFLLLLAVADDAIGLVIIALFYPVADPEWLNVLWILPAMLVAFALRKAGVQHWIAYVLLGGGLAWYGLYSANLHPALALVFIVPFMPSAKNDEGLFVEESHAVPPFALERFEHQLKLPVDVGLFFFAFANAGVVFSNMSELTWIVLLSLVIGKTFGVSLFSIIGIKLGFPLPQGMGLRHLFFAGTIASLGLTVALFVSGQAFRVETDFQGAAKMGALLSSSVAIPVLLLAKRLRLKGRAPQLDACLDGDAES